MFLSIRELEKRGWTKGQIKKYLPEPDGIEYFKKYGCRHLYSLCRIERIELTDEFKKLQQTALKKREREAANDDRRRKEYLDYLRYRMPVSVKVLSDEEVLLRAIASYNANRRHRKWKVFERGLISEYEPESRRDAGTDSDPEFLKRITVNYIRHNLTTYDALLAGLSGCPAQEEAARIIQKRVFAAIIDNYPALRDECERQMIGRGLLAPCDADTRQMLLFG
jgi:hypothetical protein